VISLMTLPCKFGAENVCSHTQTKTASCAVIRSPFPQTPGSQRHAKSRATLHGTSRVSVIALTTRVGRASAWRSEWQRVRSGVRSTERRQELRAYSRPL